MMSNSAGHCCQSSYDTTRSCLDVILETRWGGGGSRDLGDSRAITWSNLGQSAETNWGSQVGSQETGKITRKIKFKMRSA